QQALRTEVMTAAARSEITNVRDITPEAATTVGEEIDYRTFADRGLDTILEIGLVEVRLVGAGGKDPDLALSVHAMARLVDVRTNTEVYHDYALSHTSPRKRFSEWSNDEAHVLKQELNRAYGALGKSIVDEIFLTPRNHQLRTGR